MSRCAVLLCNGLVASLVKLNLDFRKVKKVGIWNKLKTNTTYFTMLRVCKQFFYLSEEAGVIILAASVLDSYYLRDMTQSQKAKEVRRFNFPARMRTDR